METEIIATLETENNKYVNKTTKIKTASITNWIVKQLTNSFRKFIIFTTYKFFNNCFLFIQAIKVGAAPLWVAWFTCFVISVDSQTYGYVFWSF